MSEVASFRWPGNKLGESRQLLGEVLPSDFTESQHLEVLILPPGCEEGQLELHSSAALGSKLFSSSLFQFPM